MSKIVAVGFGLKVVEGYLAKDAGKDAARATEAGYEASAEAQREALDYLKDLDKMPRFYREQAMGMLGEEFGLSAPQAADPGVAGQPGTEDQAFNEPPPPQTISVDNPPDENGYVTTRHNVPNPAYAEWEGRKAQAEAQPAAQPGIGQPEAAPKQSIYQRATEHPLYKQLYAGIEDSRIELSTDRMLKKAEESVMRNANVSGGFRGGGMQRQLLERGADIDERLQLHRETDDARIAQEKNAILVDAYNRQIGGLSSFAGTPDNSTNIAEGIRGIGQTEGEGLIAQGNIKQQTAQNIGGVVTGGIDNYIQAKQAGLI